MYDMKPIILSHCRYMQDDFKIAATAKATYLICEILTGTVALRILDVSESYRIFFNLT